MTGTFGPAAGAPAAESQPTQQITIGARLRANPN
jgi:hypothetical protein